MNEAEVDFGDAPDPLLSTSGEYPTLFANDGARHIISTMWLGATFDSETDGQPTGNAAGDDNDGNDDEDGVVLLGSGPSGGPYTTPYVVGEKGAVRVTIGGSVSDTHPAYLYGWIDWNQNGEWTDAGEDVFSLILTEAKDYTIEFNVPANAALGKTIGRFRLADEELEGVTGQAENGEVEDYLVDPIIEETPIEPEEEPEIESAPVAGIVIPVNKLSIIVPYLVLAILFSLIMTALTFRIKSSNKNKN